MVKMLEKIAQMFGYYPGGEWSEVVQQIKKLQDEPIPECYQEAAEKLHKMDVERKRRGIQQSEDETAEMERLDAIVEDGEALKNRRKKEKERLTKRKEEIEQRILEISESLDRIQNAPESKALKMADDLEYEAEKLEQKCNVQTRQALNEFRTREKNIAEMTESLKATTDEDEETKTRLRADIKLAEAELHRFLLDVYAEKRAGCELDLRTAADKRRRAVNTREHNSTEACVEGLKDQLWALSGIK